MSTQLINNKRFSLTEYYGGQKKGLMYQITQERGYVQLSREDMSEILNAIVHQKGFKRRTCVYQL